MAGKTGENLLNILGTVGDVFGKVLLGPDGGHIDFGAPFKMGAAMERQKREENALMEVLKGNPHTAPLVEMGHQLANNGGALGGISNEFGGQMPQTTYTPPDIQSPQFVSDYLAKGGSGEIAASFLGNQINNRQAEVDPLKQLLLMKQLSEPSWNEKQNKEFEQKQALAQQYADIATQKYAANKAEQQSYPTEKETEQLTILGDLNKQAQMIANDATNPELLKGIFVKNFFGKQVLQKNSPEFVQLAQKVSSYNNTLVQAKGGKSLTQYEGKRYEFELPQITDDPQFFAAQVARQATKQRDFQLRTQLQLAVSGKSPDKIGADPNELQTYATLNKYIEANPKTAYKNQKVLEDIKNLGLYPEFVLPYFPKK